MNIYRKQHENFTQKEKKKIIPKYLTVSYCAEGFKISSSFYVCVCGITGYHRGSVSSKLIAQDWLCPPKIHLEANFFLSWPSDLALSLRQTS